VTLHTLGAAIRANATVRIGMRIRIERQSLASMTIPWSTNLTGAPRASLAAVCDEFGAVASEQNAIALPPLRFVSFYRLPSISTTSSSSAPVAPIPLQGTSVSLTFARNMRVAGIGNVTVGDQWWSLQMDTSRTDPSTVCRSPSSPSPPTDGRHGRVESLQGVHTYIASDRIASNAITASLGVTGLLPFYLVIVYGAFRSVRLYTAGSRYRIRVDELPDTRDLVDLCDGVYIARRQLDLMREADLYDTIIRLFRSPEALLTLTGEYLKEA